MKVKHVMKLHECFFRVADNVKRLCAGVDLKHESFKLAQKPIRITTVEFSNSAPLAQNRC
jgi:hypothetical protein